MKLTGRGLKVLIALSLLLALGYLTYDYVLTALSLVGVAVLLYEALRLKAKFVNLVPPESEVRVRMLAGGEREVNLKLNVPEGSSVSSPYPWAEVRLAGGLLTLKLKPEVKGIYRLEKVVLKLTGPLGLLEAVRELPLKVEVKAYPRALPFIVEALRLLGARGVGVGIVPSEDKGIGLEYAETREYRPGDPLRLIDWKATARLSKLMVKEFFKDGEGYPYVVYNGLALGPITSDELTALLLSLLIGLSRHYPSLNLTLKLGRDDVLTGYSMSPLEALRVALAYALREYKEV